MRLKLHWKLTLLFCLTMVVGFLLGYFYLTSHLKSFLDKDLQNNLRHQAVLVRDIVQMSSAGLQPAARRIGQELGLRVTVVDAAGVVLADSSLDDEELKHVENHAGREELRDALRSGFGVSKRYSYTINKYLLYVAVPLGEGRDRGVVRLAMPMSDVALFEAGPQKMVLLALFWACILGLVFSYIISVVVSRPLRDMAEVSKAMAQGDFSRKPCVSSDDEVGDLARAITYMSAQIKDKINDIEEEKAKLDAIIANMFEGVLLVDPKGVVLLMNPSLRKMFLVSSSAEGRKAAEVIRNSVLSGMIERLLSGEDTALGQDVSFLIPDEKVLKVNGVVIRTSNKLEGAVLVFHDVTELRRLEKVRQDFVANVSHELRTPVASIKGYAETLLGGAMEDKETLKEFLTTIHQNGDRLVGLINDLLDLARIESGRMKVVVAPVDAAGIIQRTFAILGKIAADKGLIVTVDIPADLPRVMADEARLAQVVLNLLDNAVKYTPEGGKITLTAKARALDVRFDVVDTGIGIPEEDLPRIFERFYRVDKARSRDLGGTGLGLSIVKHIVLAHGGEVFVASQLGKGATFGFTLPRA